MSQDRGNPRNVKVINVITNSQEDLQEMNDDRLAAIKDMLKGKIYSLSKARGKEEADEKMKELQTEHSYVSRELEVRQNRKRLHEQYLQKIRANRPYKRRYQHQRNS